MNWPSLTQARPWRGGLDDAEPSSGMLRRYRRYFALLAFGLLATPLLVGIVKPDSAASILNEGRNPAPAPRPPDSLGDWLTLPKETDAYLQEKFGLRQALIRAHRELTKPLFRGYTVLIGRDGRMFYLGDQMVRQSAGLVMRDQAVAQVTNLLARMNEQLRARGIRFLVAPPPNASTVYQDDLPLRAQNTGRPTEYDLLLTNLAAKGVLAVDLRPAVKNARAGGSVFYMHDTHWTFRGALAAFNAVVEADSRADWQIDPSSALGPPAVHKGGDLARMLGVSDKVWEYTEDLTLPHGKRVLLSSDPHGDFIETSDKPGPTILIFGDLLTLDYFPPMLLQHVDRVIWIHHRYCAVDWRVVDEFQPDEVWWMPGERVFLCASGAWPIGFPEAKDEVRERKAPAGLEEPVEASGDREGVRTR